MEKNYRKCFFIGHETPKEENDCGYRFCKRCSAHEYYDGMYYNEGKIGKWELTLPGLLWFVYLIVYCKWKYKIQPKIFVRCDCGKLESVFTKPIGNHERCLPF